VVGGKKFYQFNHLLTCTRKRLSKENKALLRFDLTRPSLSKRWPPSPNWRGLRKIV